MAVDPDCFHCFVGTELGRRLEAGMCPREAHRHLCEVISNFIASHPEPARRVLLEATHRMLEEMVAADAESFAAGLGMDPLARPN